jgi:putative MATE family efflux protein
LEFLVTTLIVLADSVLLARLGTEVLAGVGLAITVFRVFYESFIGVASASTTVVAQAVGAGNLDLARRGAAQSVMLAVLVGIVSGGVGALAASSVMELMGTGGLVKQAGTVYMQINLLASPLYAAALAGGGVLKGVGDTRTPMVFTLVASVIKIMLSVVLVFGHLGFPAMGVAGAALATLVAYGVNALLVVAKLWRGFDGISLRPGSLKLDRRLMVRIIRLSSPVAAERIIMRVGFTFYIRMVSALGTVALAANTIAVRLESISLTVGFGFTIAATTLVGLAVGRGDIAAAKEKALATLRLAVLTLGSMTVVLILLRHLAVGVFAPESDVRGLATACLVIGAFELPALGVLFTFAGALRGAGDTRSPMFVALVGTFLFRLPLVYLLGLHFGLGLKGIWYGTLLDWIGRAILIFLVFRSGRWMRKPFIDEAERVES